ncbi:MAG: hypothetical protein KF805_15220 [Phycisphaeraceae bacterium]|nr:hypothetical protein [Phycisphaeraceae bacterium]
MKKTLLKSTCWSVVLAGIGFALGAATPVRADTLTWTGLGDGVSFSSVANWSPAKSPGAGDDCVIPSGAGTINTTGILEIQSLQTARNVSIDGCSRLTLTGGLALVGGARVSIAGACTGLIFSGGTQSISGDGEIQILTNAVASTILFATSVQATISPGVSFSFASTASGASASVSIASSCRVVNLGTIQSLKSGGVLSLTGSGELVNQGTMSVSNNSTLRVQVSKWNNAGTLKSVRGTLVLSNTWSSTGQLVVEDAGTANLQGSWTNFGFISADSSTLSFEGGWINAGAASLMNATWLVGGNSTSLGSFTRVGGGRIELRGTLTTPVFEATEQTGLIFADGATFVGTTLKHIGGPGFSIASVKLNGCTLACDLESPSTVVLGGLTLSQGARLRLMGLATGTALTFAQGTQSVQGTGGLVFNSSGIAVDAGAILTIAPGVVIEYDAAATSGHIWTAGKLTLQTPIIVPTGKVLTIDGYGQFVNASTIRGAGAAVTISAGQWTNSGSVEVTDGALTFGGAWTNAGTFAVTNSTWTIGGGYASLGNYTFIGGSMIYAGGFSGSSLIASAQTGDIALNNLTLTNCTLSAIDGAKFVLAGTVKLLNCTLATSVSVDPCVVLRVENGLILASNASITIRTSAPCYSSGLVFAGGNAQSVTGNGQIIINPDGPSVPTNVIQVLSDTKVSLGAGISLACGNGGSNEVYLGTNTSLTTSGAIDLVGSGQLRINSGTFFHAGGLINIRSSSLTVDNMIGPVGAVELAAGGSLTLRGNYQLDQPIAVPANAKVVLTGVGTILSPLTFAAGSSLSTNGSFSFLADMTAAQTSMTLDGTWLNAATLKLTGGSLDLNGSWSNAGLFDINGAVWKIGGTYPALGGVSGVGNTITLRNTFPEAVLQADATNGDISIENLALSGVLIRTRDGAKVRVVSNVTLDGCSVDGTLRFTTCNSVASVRNNLTLINGARVEVDKDSCISGALMFEASQQMIAGNGSVIAVRGSPIELTHAATLTIGPDVTITNESGSGLSSLYTWSDCSLVNYGTIVSRSSSPDLRIYGVVYNYGLIEAAAGSITVYELRNLGRLRTSGGVLAIAGLTGALGDLELVAGGCNISGEYTIDRAINAPPGTSLWLMGTFTTSAPITGDHAGIGIWGTCNLDAELSIQGGSLDLAGAWTNHSLLAVNNASLSFDGAWSNYGAFDIRNTAWTIGGTYSSLGNTTAESNSYTYSGAYPGSSLRADATTRDVTLRGVTLNGVALTSRDGAKFIVSGGFSGITVLNACSLDGGLLVNNCSGITISGGISFVSGAIMTFDDPFCSTAGIVFAAGPAQSILGSGEIRLKGVGTSPPIQINSSLTMAAGVTLRYGSDATGPTQTTISISSGKNFTSAGSIVAERNGATLLFAGGSFTNSGIVRSSAGSLTFLANVTNATGTFNRVLTGGKWQALGGALSLGGSPIGTIAAGTELLVSGQSNTIPIATVGTLENRGLLSVTGRVMTISTLRNYGTLEFGPGAKVTASTIVFQPSSMLSLPIAGVSAGQFGVFSATTVLAQGGVVRPRFIAPYSPAEGDHFDGVFVSPAFYYAFDAFCSDANTDNLGVATILATSDSPHRIDLFVSPDTGLFPVITQQPAGATASPNAVFTVAAAPLDIAYQWRKDGVQLTNGPTGHGSVISGAGDSTLTITSATPQDVGAYDVAVANSCGTTFSHPALLRICPGDLNNDGLVDDADFLIFLASYNILDCADPSMPSYCPADFNQDAVVDDADFLLFIPAYNDLLCP